MVLLMQELRTRAEAAVGDILLPVQPKETDREEDQRPRAAEVHLVRLEEMDAPQKKAPYILHALTGLHAGYGERVDGMGGKSPERHLVTTAEVVSVFCVYGKTQEEGGLYLLELMDAVRQDWLKRPAMGAYFLDMDKGLEGNVYDGAEWDLGSFHVGSIASRWVMKRERRGDVAAILRGEDPDAGHYVPLKEWTMEPRG